MQLQETPFGCGPTALLNAYMALGHQKPPTQAAIAELCGTTTDGTNAAQLKRGIRKLDYVPVALRASTSEEAWSLLIGWLYRGCPVIVSVDKDEHWATAIGALGPDRVHLVDSADGAVVVTWDKEQFLEKWKGRDRRRPYYGVVVAEREP